MCQDEPIRVAMWSGPRNISTAMMRAWENRPDTLVIDEPLYASYLKMTGKNHLGGDEVLADGETDWRKVDAPLLGPIPVALHNRRAQPLYQLQNMHRL